MGRNLHSQAKRQRETEKAQKKQAKREKKAQRSKEKDSTDSFEVVSVDDIVGRLPTASEALRKMEDRAKAPRAAATVPCKLFVGSLTDMVTETVLMDLFSKYGKVSEAVIIKDRDSNQSRGFAFVTYENRHDSTKAIQELDGYELDGRYITVKVATKR